MPEFLKKRFGGDRIRFYQTILALILSIFTKISVDLYSGAIFLNQALGWNMYVSVIALVALAAIFTISGKSNKDNEIIFFCDILFFLGGLSAVIWTDFIQTIIMIISAFILMIICYVKIGGLQLIKEIYPYALADTTLFNNTTCGIPPEDYFSLIRPLNSANGPPWVGIIGMTILSIWYWCR
jgi:Na+/proline symporter